MLPIPIGSLRQGQRGFALQVRRQLRIERGVDTGDKKAGHQLRRDLACALRQALLIGLVGAYGLGAGEQQGEVDVDAVGYQDGQGGEAGIGSGDFNHGIGAADQIPQAARFGNGAFGVVRECGVAFEAHQPAVTFCGKLCGKHIAGGLHVGHGQGFVACLRRKRLLL